jgi:hypothetical protein
MENDMTKRHFESLARHIRDIMDPAHRLSAAVAVANAAVAMSPRFDADRFFIACAVVGPLKGR